MMVAALAYHRQGYLIVPTYSPRMFHMANFKHFRFNKWASATGKVTLRSRFCQYPLRSEEEIRYWFTRYPNANIKVATGAESGIVILDVDYYGGGREKAASLNLPETRRVESGNGCHYYFLYPQGHYLPSLRDAFGRGVSISFMAEKGSVCIPPSVYSNGQLYRFDNEQTAIAPLPPELVEQLVPHKELSRIYIILYFQLRYVLIIFPLLRLLLVIKRTAWLKWIGKHL